MKAKVSQEVSDFIKSFSTMITEYPGYYHISCIFEVTDDPLVFDIKAFTEAPSHLKDIVAKQLEIKINDWIKYYEPEK